MPTVLAVALSQPDTVFHTNGSSTNGINGSGIVNGKISHLYGDYKCM